MKNQQINIAIAEACGWKHIAFNRGWIKAGDGETQCVIPNYCENLKLMHEAEKILTADQFEQYRWVLWDICKQLTVKEWYRAHLSATARQRAEAFLKTIGKWEDAK